MNLKSGIEKLRDSNYATYRLNHDRFIADYNREQELTKEYNGRQLLELLQNADDAEASEVRIDWRSAEDKLIIQNNGLSFTAAGIKSLMLANLSTKTKISYIGNKGLGFRSVLNWAKHISIYSEGCKVSFSAALAAQAFGSLGLTDHDISAIREDRSLSDRAIPFPVLAIPDIIEDSTTTAGMRSTIIEISYNKDYEKDISKQIDEIREEILLFLNHINSIVITHDGHTSTLIRTKPQDIADNRYTLISIRDKHWKVFNREKQLPDAYQDTTKNERQSYNLKIAIQDDLSDNYFRLFNFFPTQLSVQLPCIIHGTFELNSSRNHLNNSNKNNFIITELIELFRECALFLTGSGLDWRAYSLLTALQPSDSELLQTLYTGLEKLKKEMSIYPGVYDSYQTLDSLKYYNSDFSRFVGLHFASHFPELLMSPAENVVLGFENKKLSHPDLVRRIDELSPSISDVAIRAELIVLLSQLSLTDSGDRFSLLVTDQDQVIDKDDVAFTPVIKSEQEFSIPHSVKVAFIHKSLYEILIARLEEKFDPKEPKQRELQRAIKSVVNIQAYDSNAVIDKIVTGSKDALKEITDNASMHTIITQMVTALLTNFKNIANRQDKLKVIVPLINVQGQKRNADELFLGDSYPTGPLIKDIYRDILTSSDYLAEMTFWSFTEEDPIELESFFEWLGVNRFSKTEVFSLQSNWPEQTYFDFIFNNGTIKPDNFGIHRITKDALLHRIVNFDQILRIPLTRLILLTLKDNLIRKQIENSDERISWSFSGVRPSIIPGYSYIRYQFHKANICTRYIMEESGEELNKLINNDLEIDYDLLKRYNISKSEVRSVLVKLGAKESFSDLGPEDVYDIIKAVPQRDTTGNGKNTQSVYKMALESLVERNADCKVPTEISFFANQGTIGEYKKSSEIYYSDNATLPRKIMDTLYIINLPKRVGEDNVTKHFGVKSLKSFKIEIDSNIRYNQLCNSEFVSFFESIKPYLLAYRLYSPNLKKKILGEDKKKQDAKAIRLCDISIVAECLYRFGEKTAAPIEDGEFINKDDNFYYKYSRTSLDSLKKDSVFCDAFAEMICMTFRLNDLKNDFRQILKNDLQDTHHLTLQDIGQEKLDEVYKLLGISRKEIDFWKNIFTLKEHFLPESIESSQILKDKIKAVLDLNIPIGYQAVDFDLFNNKESYSLIKAICNQLSLSVNDILPKGLMGWHESQFSDLIMSNGSQFEQLLWADLCSKKEQQSSFITTLTIYRQGISKWLKPKIESHRYDLTIDYQTELRNSIKEEFNLNIEGIIEKTSIVNLYESLLMKYSVDEADISAEAIRSLLFFNGNNDEIEKYLKSTQSEPSTEKDNQELALVTGHLIDASLSSNAKNTLDNGQGHKGGTWIHSDQKENGKKQRGKKAEALVYNTLVKQYGSDNVKWVSGYSPTPQKTDSLHYDIEYKNQNGEWKYLEVKSIYDDQFIISSAEVEKGMAEPTKYELALVKADYIYIVKDVFNFKSGETLEFNNKFKAIPKDYTFTFKIDEISNN